jgi:gamma-tubulin complex component 5
MAFAEFFLEDLRNSSNPASALTWQNILAEEPYSGQHWEGVYGLPLGSTTEKWEAHSTDSTESLSPIDQSDGNSHDEDGSLSSSGVDESISPEDSHVVTKAMNSKGTTLSHRNLVEYLQSKQYWRHEWRTDASLTAPFDLGDASTLGISSGSWNAINLIKYQARPSPPLLASVQWCLSAGRSER